MKLFREAKVAGTRSAPEKLVASVDSSFVVGYTRNSQDGSIVVRLNGEDGHGYRLHLSRDDIDFIRTVDAS